MINIGRNEPCPCKSGKKYKKCCLSKVETNASIHTLDYAQQLNITIDGVPAIKAISKHISEEQLIKYHKALSKVKDCLDSDNVDDDSIFKLFRSLYSRACEVAKFDDFFKLVLQLKVQQPHIYKKEGQYIVNSCIDAKLRLEELEDAGAFFIEYCYLCDDNLDAFNRIINKLFYYGCTEIILQGIIIIWPAVKASSELFDRAKSKLKVRYCQLVCFSEFLNSNGTPSIDDIVKKVSMIDFDETKARKEASNLLEVLSYKKPIQSEYIKTNMHTLIKQNDSLGKIIYPVLDAFISHLVKDNTINPCIAMSYWLSLTGYISDRVNGDLDLNREEILHLFSPERKSLDKYIFYNFTSVISWNIEPHRVIIFLKAIIHWVIFLFKNDLIDSASIIMKKISSLYITLYEMLTPENSSKNIKNDAKEMLITLRDLIENGDK